MIPIEKDDKRIRWHQIKAEYIAGASQRSLAEKYGVSRTIVSRHSRLEGWAKAREKAKADVLQKVIQETAETAADNATIAARIKSKLLRKLEKEIDALPDMIGSETRNSVTEMDHSKGKKVVKEASKSYKLRDLAAAYKDLTADMVTTETAGNELLQSLIDLERRVDRD